MARCPTPRKRKYRRWDEAAAHANRIGDAKAYRCRCHRYHVGTVREEQD